MACGKRGKSLRANRSGCGGGHSREGLTTYAAVVRDYLKTCRSSAREQLDFYASRPSLAKAVELAALAKDDRGKRCSHQRRIPASALSESYARLRRLRLNRYRSFEQLIEAISRAVSDIPRIGPLTIYDTALRIGAYLELEPKEVHLHTGTRDGARALGLGRDSSVLRVSDLPPAFRTLSPGEIEDCLCIYKDELRQIARGERRRVTLKRRCR